MCFLWGLPAVTRLENLRNCSGEELKVSRHGLLLSITISQLLSVVSKERHNLLGVAGTKTTFPL